MAGHDRVVEHRMTLQQKVEYGLSLLCAQLGCSAIVARAMWSAGDQTTVAEASAGAAEGDVMRLKRMQRPKVPR